MDTWDKFGYDEHNRLIKIDRTDEEYVPYVHYEDMVKCVNGMPTAYSVNKVVEELEETMQDLNVIEILSHIDFDRTIQIGLDNFLKSYNSELLRIVKHGGVTDDSCEWRLCDEEANVYDTSCRNPHILIEGTPRENNYSYCPYCGKKIKVVD